MKRFFLTLAFVLIAAPVLAVGTVEKACVRSPQQGASRSLCGCIQDAADLTLSGTDQRLAAKIFRNPAKAQEIRQSDRASYASFWKRYKNFGSVAEVYCSN